MATSDLDAIGQTTRAQQAARAKLEKLIIENGAMPLTKEEMDAMGHLVVTNNRKHFVGVDGLTVISEDNP